jgi:hypothetical protein
MLSPVRVRLGVKGHRPLVLAAVLAALVALGPAAASADAAKVTFIGDSKSAAIEYSTTAKQLLAKGHKLRRDLKVCRRLVAQSCRYNGVRPLTALGAVKKYGRGLGTVLVVDVGYNDSSATYKKQMVTVVKAARARGVKGIVWVNLRVVRGHMANYRGINAAISNVYKRRPIVYLANWNAYSRNHPAWFPKGGDGIHLTQAGAIGLVKLVRKYIARAANGPRQTSAVAAVTGSSGTGGTEAAPAPQSEEQAAAEGSSASAASSLAVGRNLSSTGGSASVSGVLPFVGGALLMLFLIVVTVKAGRGRLGRSPAA